MSQAFKTLYEALTNCSLQRLEPSRVSDLLKLAGLNKVLLHFMRAAGLEGELRESEEARLNEVTKVVEMIVNEFKDLDYSFYKLVKPVAYVPADIDILIRREHLSLAVSRLKRLRFRLDVVEPYSITMRSPTSIVDLYVHPVVGGMIYLDAGRLMEHRGEASFHGLEVPCLEKYAEALVAATHALYKEMMYTLNDYITVRSWTSSKTVMLAEELGCRPALNLAEALNGAIEAGILETPYKLPISLWARLIVQKLAKDRLARATSVNLLNALSSRRGLKQLVSKLVRETY